MTATQYAELKRKAQEEQNNVRYNPCDSDNHIITTGNMDR